MTPEPFIFGKVPHRGDFVRAGSIGPLVDELDDWLQRAVMALRGGPAGDAHVAFAMGRPSGILLGVLRSSHDRAGRSFPLVAGGTISGAALTGAEVTSRGPFFNAAVAATDAVVAGQPLDDGVAGLRVPPFPGRYDGLGPADVFGGVPVEGVVGTLVRSLGPFAQPQAPKYGLGLPLPADPARRAAGAAFWLDAISARSTGRPVRTMLWHPRADRARLAYFAGPATADALAYLVTSTPVDGVFDVDAAEPPSAPAALTLGALLVRS